MPLDFESVAQLMARISLEDLVPQGILETDFVHVVTNDNTCSRCRAPMPEDSAPLTLWAESNPDNLLLYCRRCLAAPRSETTNER